MAVLKLLVADRTSLAAELLALWDSGAGPCLLEFYTGAILAGPATAITTQVKLGTLTCSDPLGTASAGALTFGAITQDAAADNSGDATWARLVDGNGVARAVIDVTGLAGNGACKLNTVTIYAGGPIQVSSCVLTFGGA